MPHIEPQKSGILARAAAAKERATTRAVQPKLPRVQSNVATMIERGAADREIREYLALEGVTQSQLRSFGAKQALAQQRAKVEAQLKSFRELGLEGSGMSIDMFRFVSDQPRFVDRFVGKAGAEALGATALGVPATVIAGPAAGAIAAVGGAVAGRGGFRIAQQVEDILQFGRGVPTTPGQVLRESAEAAGFEATGQAGVQALMRAPGVVPKVIGLGLGLGGKEATKLAGRFRSQQVAPTPVNVSRRVFALTRPLSVMPIVSRVAQLAQEKTLVQISRRFQGLMDDIAQAHALPQLGEKIGQVARTKFNLARIATSRLYVDMYDAFARIGNPRVIPTSPFKAQAKEISGQLDQLPREVKQVTRETGVLGPTGEPITKTVEEAGARVGVLPPTDDILRGFLMRFENLPEFITPVEFRALQKALNGHLRLRTGAKGSEFDVGVLLRMQKAGGEALESINPDLLPVEHAARIRGKIRNANVAYAQLMARIRSPAAKRISAADPSIFAFGQFTKGGRIEIDQLASDFLGAQSTLRSPDFVKSLDGLIGTPNRRALARAVIIKAAKAEGVEDVTAAVVKRKGRRLVRKLGLRETVKETELVDIVTIDGNAMEDALGLGITSEILGGGATKTSADAVAALLEGTGIKLSTLKQFIAVVKRNQEVVVGQPSVFMTRRLMLTGKFTMPSVGGRPTIPEEAGIIGRTLGKIVDIGGVIMGGRLATRLLTSEKGLRLLTEGMRQNAGRSEVLRFIVRLRRSFPEEDITIRELPPEVAVEILGQQEQEREESEQRGVPVSERSLPNIALPAAVPLGTRRELVNPGLVGP